MTEFNNIPDMLGRLTEDQRTRYFDATLAYKPIPDDVLRALTLEAQVMG